MISKASEIRTWYVEPYEDETIDKVVNRTLSALGEREIISINYQKSQNEMIADSALIIYKEVTQ